MAFDTALRDRILAALADVTDITGKPLFGGYGVFRNGVMFAGVFRTSLIAKLRDGVEDALREPHTGGFQPPGGAKPMTGWILVDPAGIATDEALRDWLDRAIAAIPMKAEKKPPRKKKSCVSPAASNRSSICRNRHGWCWTTSDHSSSGQKYFMQFRPFHLTNPKTERIVTMRVNSVPVGLISPSSVERAVNLAQAERFDAQFRHRLPA